MQYTGVYFLDHRAGKEGQKEDGASPAWAGRFFITEPPGKPTINILRLKSAKLLSERTAERQQRWKGQRQRLKKIGFFVAFPTMDSDNFRALKAKDYQRWESALG